MMRPFAKMRAFVPLLRESGDSVIVNISSGAAQSGTSSSIIYGASKAALNTITMAVAGMAVARVLGPEIRVVRRTGYGSYGLSAGPHRGDDGKSGAWRPRSSAIEPENVALAVISCVTHLTHTNGSIIAVDAGRHL